MEGDHDRGPQYAVPVEVPTRPMTTSLKQCPPRGRGAFPAPLAGHYIAGCSEVLGGVLSPLLAVLFVRLDDALYDLADKATNSRPYPVYFEAMRIIRKQSQAIQASFLRLLRQTADSAAAGLLECDLLCDADSETLSQDLSLSQDADLEETLAVANLVSKAESRYCAVLLEVNVFLARLLDREHLDMRSNPFGPFAVCEAFRGALKVARQLEPQIKIVIYNVFDKQVMDHLGAFYRRCLDAALAAGHVPADGPAAFAAARLAPATDQGEPGAFRILQDSDGVIVLDPESVEDTTAVAFETLQDLLERRRSPAGAPAAAPLVIPTRELQGLLTQLGARVLADGNGAGFQVRQRLRSALASPGARPRSLEPNDQDTLDLVFMFFEQLFEGNVLPDPIKVLLAPVQFPIAKLALLDKNFFSRHEHPARQLLNHIGESAVGWSEADGRGPETLFGMIERVVERLILDFDGDCRLFAQMDRFFVAYIAHDQARTREAEARVLAGVRPAAEGPAQQAVAAALEAALIRYAQVPTVVESILRQGWQPVMLATYQGGGTDSPDWRAVLDLVDRLLWSVQPKTHSEERRQFLRRIPEILRALRSRLTAGGCDQHQLAHWFRDLQALHLAVLRGDTHTGFAPTRPARPSLVPPVALVPASGDVPARPPAPALTLGGWIELTRDDATRVRLKLVWRGPDGARLLFVDRAGRPGSEFSGPELAGLIMRRQVILLGRDHDQLADCAMRSVMGRLAS